MPNPNTILVNSRVLMLKANGQKRVAEELVRRMPALVPIAPSESRSSGLSGHAWEQFYLPLRAAGHPLWSPSTSGPVMHGNHVVTMHDTAFIDIPQYFNKSFARWYSSMTARLAHSARHIVTVSDFTRKRVIEAFGIESRKVTTIHLGVTTAFERRSEQEISAVLSRLGVPNQPYVIGFSGTDPRKNTRKLLEAWVQSQAVKQGAHLVLFGRAANLAVFAGSTVHSDIEGVIRVGAVDDNSLAALYSGANGFVFPSFYEGFGLPVIEAAHCGARIVTSRVSSLPEVSPTDAILIDPFDVASIADAIRNLIVSSDREEDRGRRIQEMTNFRWERAAEQYSKLFAEVFA